jgi:hypothetical protein
MSPTAQMSLSAIAAVSLKVELLINGLGTIWSPLVNRVRCSGPSTRRLARCTPGTQPPVCHDRVLDDEKLISTGIAEGARSSPSIFYFWQKCRV